MAVSGLEQRRVPMIITCPLWSPWGPGVVSPWPEEGDLSDCEDEMAKPQMRRNRSWGGFPTYTQLTRYPLPCSLSEENSSPHSNDEIDSPLTVMSDPMIPIGRRSKKQRRRKLNPNLFNLLAKPSDVVLTPVLLGGEPMGMNSKENTTCFNVIPSNQQVNLLEAGTIDPKVLKTTERTPITTLMVRNLPYSLTQQELLQAMDESGHAGMYDFIYLPHKFREHKNLGFAFVNFIDADSATKFSTEWHHTYRFKLGGIRKPLNISAAAVQGRVANERAANSHKMGRVKNGFFRPLLLVNSNLTGTDGAL